MHRSSAQSTYTQIQSSQFSVPCWILPSLQLYREVPLRFGCDIKKKWRMQGLFSYIKYSKTYIMLYISKYYRYMKNVTVLKSWEMRLQLIKHCLKTYVTLSVALYRSFINKYTKLLITFEPCEIKNKCIVAAQQFVRLQL